MHFLGGTKGGAGREREIKSEKKQDTTFLGESVGREETEEGEDIRATLSENKLRV